MLPELGNFLLSLAFALAVLLAVYPLWGVKRRDSRLMRLACSLTYGLCLCTSCSFLCLVYAFISHDFTLAYVANHSNTLLPVYYRIAAVWGSHEGSLLLWVMMLSWWSLAVVLFRRQITLEMLARIMAVMGMINSGFLLFTLFTSNPFSRILPDFPIDGADLNPLLQDIGLIFHPPLLYMGYVGFAVTFAFAIAALMAGRVDSAWSRLTRPWAIAAWIFLTLGILLGSIWAYYELGWGGWWFWDPVENASLMPWLSATALIHSLLVTEKRQIFKNWTILLAISTFSLCLLGAFLVRSGILVSVHAFAADPAKGVILLLYLVLVIGGSLLLYATKSHRQSEWVDYGLFCRETLLLGNNLLLVAATLVVVLGTLLPLIHRQLGLGAISIGEPFFNQMFTYLMLPFAFLLGITPLLRWRRDKFNRLSSSLIIITLVSILGAILLPRWLEGYSHFMAVTGLFMAIWITAFSFKTVYADGHFRRLSLNHWGMVLAHLGVAATIVGVSFSQNYSLERNVKMNVGDDLTLVDYQFVFHQLNEIKGPNYLANVAVIMVSKKGQPVTQLQPEKRYYHNARSMMTEAAIDGNFRRDLYVALGQPQEDGSWSMRIYYKPLVRWIWYGALMMTFGGCLCLWATRYRATSRLRY